jgi:hypothetical protein
MLDLFVFITGLEGVFFFLEAFFFLCIGTVFQGMIDHELLSGLFKRRIQPRNELAILLSSSTHQARVVLLMRGINNSLCV